jgi:hypothetical protein
MGVPDPVQGRGPRIATPYEVLVFFGGKRFLSKMNFLGSFLVPKMVKSHESGQKLVTTPGGPRM